MRESIPHAAQLLRERNLAGLADKATRNARWWLADGVCILLAFTFTLAWAVDEVSNDVPSWHTSVAGGEHFTFAGWWVAFVGIAHLHLPVLGSAGYGRSWFGPGFCMESRSTASS